MVEEYKVRLVLNVILEQYKKKKKKKPLWPSAPCIHPSVPRRSISSHNLAFPISGYWFKCILPAYTVSGCWWRSRPRGRGRLSTCIFRSVAASSPDRGLENCDYIHNTLALSVKRHKTSVWMSHSPSVISSHVLLIVEKVYSPLLEELWQRILRV